MSANPSSTLEDIVVTAGNPLVISGPEPTVLNLGTLVLEDGAEVIVEAPLSLNAQATVSKGTGTIVFQGADGARGANGANGAPGRPGANGQSGQQGQPAPGGELNLGVASGRFVIRSQPGNGGTGGNGGNGGEGGGAGGAGGFGGNGGNGTPVQILYTPGDPPPTFDAQTVGGIGGAGGAGGMGTPPGPAGAAGSNGIPGQIIIRQQ